MGRIHSIQRNPAELVAAGEQGKRREVVWNRREFGGGCAVAAGVVEDVVVGAAAG